MRPRHGLIEVARLVQSDIAAGCRSTRQPRNMHIQEVVLACGSIAIFCLAAGCGDSAVITTPGAPSPARCSVSVSTTNSTVPATGGTGVLKIATERECSWTASADVAWITLNGPRDGFGPADIPFTVAANPTVASRRGALVVNGQRAELTQAPAPPPPVPGPCAVSLAPSALTIGAAAGTGTIAVTAAASCGWNATSSATWLTIVAGNAGSGNGTIRFQAAANSGSSRVALVRVNDRTATVTQDAPR